MLPHNVTGYKLSLEFPDHTLNVTVAKHTNGRILLNFVRIEPLKMEGEIVSIKNHNIVDMFAAVFRDRADHFEKTLNPEAYAKLQGTIDDGLFGRLPGIIIEPKYRYYSFARRLFKYAEENEARLKIEL